MAANLESPHLKAPPGVQSVLLALSGGPDSMCLLHMLLPLCQDHSIKLYAAHLDHGLREESRKEAAFLQDYCAALQVPLAVERGDVRAEAARSGRGTEDAGRQLRHGFLRRQTEAWNADCIALGHHMDDQVETMLLHLGRGSGLTGLCAMREYRPPLWRPLLNLRKADIMAFLARENIPYFIDATNDSAEYARNRTRKLLGGLDSIHPRFVENAARSASILQAEDDLLRSLAATALADLVSEAGLDAAAWQKLHPALGMRVLRLYAERCGLAQGLYVVHLEGLANLCHGPSGRQIDLPQGKTARLDYGRLLICDKREDEEEDFLLPLALGENPTPHGTFTVEAKPKPEKLGQNWPAAAECDPAALVGAVLRPPREGDRMRPLGMSGHKKLSDIWTDKKIPLYRRNKVILARGEDVLLLPGLCVSALCDAKNCREIWEISFI